MNYAETAKNILNGVGGSSNVENVKHCVTRLRFNLCDESVADTEGIKQIKGVLTVIQQAGQYQVVIGNEVGNVYAELIKLLNNGEVEKKEESKSVEAL